MAFTVPPGGLAGFSQMTPASKRALFPGSSGSGRAPTRRRRSKSPKARTRKSRKSGGGRKMKFGSPAWQKKYGVGKFRKK